MNRRQVIAIGASTGGVLALTSLIERMPRAVPPILIVQHILPSFSRRFAERLDERAAIRVVEAAHGEALDDGCAYVAPPHAHLLVRAIRGELRTWLSPAPPVRFHRPAVDVLFHSLAELDAVDVVAVLLTGMGRDGADGMLALRRRGARTIAQDQATSAVFGMPREAILNGGARNIAPLEQLPEAILAALQPCRHSAAG